MLADLAAAVAPIVAACLAAAQRGCEEAARCGARAGASIALSPGLESGRVPPVLLTAAEALVRGSTAAIYIRDRRTGSHRQISPCPFRFARSMRASFVVHKCSALLTNRLLHLSIATFRLTASQAPW